MRGGFLNLPLNDETDDAAGGLVPPHATPPAGVVGLADGVGVWPGDGGVVVFAPPPVSSTAATAPPPPSTTSNATIVATTRFRRRRRRSAWRRAASRASCRCLLLLGTAQEVTEHRPDRPGDHPSSNS